jgi:hypothetical protein
LCPSLPDDEDEQEKHPTTQHINQQLCLVVCGNKSSVSRRRGGGKAGDYIVIDILFNY